MAGMTIVYAHEKAPEAFESSIFLVGPTPTKNRAHSWRTDALRLLQEAGYEGVVFLPEKRPDKLGNTRFQVDYIDQVEWEFAHLRLADVILAWVPRTLENPGITTNYELGEFMDSGKVVFGAPKDSWKTRYPRYWAEKRQVPTSFTLEETVNNALALLGEGLLRHGGERFVPPYIWKTVSFQQWYGNLKKAGNRLDSAEVVWSWRVGPRRKLTFFWIIHAKVWVESESRYKDNEVVLARPDISVTVLYKRAEKLDDCEVVLIKEFRTPVSNSEGYVYENPGGSSWEERADPLECASEEVHEETGIAIEASRFTYHGARQIAPTVSAHRAHLFSAPVTDEQLRQVDAGGDMPHGVAEDTERTYALRAKVGDIRQQNLVGWPDLGMILYVLS